MPVHYASRGLSNITGNKTQLFLKYWAVYSVPVCVDIAEL